MKMQVCYGSGRSVGSPNPEMLILDLVLFDPKNQKSAKNKLKFFALLAYHIIRIPLPKSSVVF
jgi:hypothetical protein